MVTVLRFSVTFISLLGDKLYKVNYLLENISFSFPVEVAKSEVGLCSDYTHVEPLNDSTHISLQEHQSSISHCLPDVSTITEALLEQTPRAKKVDEELTVLFSLIDNDKIKEAKDMLDTLENKYSNGIPELSQAKAMIQCIDIDDEEDC